MMRGTHHITGEGGRREVVAEKQQNSDLWDQYSKLRMLFSNITGDWWRSTIKFVTEVN
jgi:hypothetical protein